MPTGCFLSACAQPYTNARGCTYLYQYANNVRFKVVEIYYSKDFKRFGLPVR
ncbi:hypothetical protein IV102_17790 [bacterium]|nr:hypothetical protein [bacterium]